MQLALETTPQRDAESAQWRLQKSCPFNDYLNHFLAYYFHCACRVQCLRSHPPGMASLRSLYTQLFPPKPTFTEDNVPSQQGKVFIVTGGNSGVGFELCKILYGTGATVYMASRSEV